MVMPPHPGRTLATDVRLTIAVRIGLTLVRACPADLAGQAPGPEEGSALEREGEVAGELAAQPDCRNESPLRDQSLDLGP